jgi:STAS-like domain of unknown function (DUF4325)
MGASTIKIPTSLPDKELPNFFKGWRWIRQATDRVTFDFRGVDFLAPWAVTLFAAYMLWLREKRGAQIEVVHDDTTFLARYLTKCGFFDLFDPNARVEDPRAGSDVTGRLTRIQQSRDIPKFAGDVMAMLAIGDEDLEGAVKYSLVELLRNVVQHSRSPVGGTALAQYFPNTGLVEVAVADFGIGIAQALRPRYEDLDSDLKALKFSLLPHVSGTFGRSEYGSMQDNAGLGLFFIKEIATRAGGGFHLGSGAALVNLWGNQDGSPGRKYLASPVGGWPGTFAVLQLRKKSIERFESLLQVCRGLAAEARKDPRTVNLDFVDEVPEIDGLNVITVKEFEEDVERAAEIRDTRIIPALDTGQLVVLDFRGVPFATQSFVHALLYKVLRDHPSSRVCLTVAGCSPSSREAVRAVAAYATLEKPS